MRLNKKKKIHKNVTKIPEKEIKRKKDLRRYMIVDTCYLTLLMYIFISLTSTPPLTF